MGTVVPLAHTGTGRSSRTTTFVPEVPPDHALESLVRRLSFVSSGADRGSEYDG